MKISFEILILIVLAIIVIGVLIYQGINKSPECSSSNPCVKLGNVYEGPITQDGDENYFRKTGETRRR